MTDAEIKKALEQLAPRRPIIVSDALRGALLGVEFDTLQAGAGLLPCPTCGTEPVVEEKVDSHKPLNLPDTVVFRIRCDNPRCVHKWNSDSAWTATGGENEARVREFARLRAAYNWNDRPFKTQENDK
jgi:hypothetical protein